MQGRATVAKMGSKLEECPNTDVHDPGRQHAGRAAMARMCSKPEECFSSHLQQPGRKQAVRGSMATNAQHGSNGKDGQRA